VQRNVRPTPEEKKAYFDKALKDAVELGVNPDNPQMIEPESRNIIYEITDQYPDVKPALIKKARKVFRDYYSWLTS
jgi:hypothetical protein